MGAEVALVTGAADGIGLATAKFLARTHRYQVVLADINVEQVAREADALVGEGCQARAVALDVSQAGMVDGIVQATEDEVGPIAALVTAAGNVRAALFHKMSDEDWAAVIHVHLFGTFYCLRRVVPRMMERRAGRVVCLTSPAGVLGTFGQANYGAAKAGIIGLMKSVAREVAPTGVTVNAVNPIAATRMMSNVLNNPKLRELFLRDIPLGRFADPAEIAPLIGFLCSHDAAYMTGQVVGINGGRTMQ